MSRACGASSRWFVPVRRYRTLLRRRLPEGRAFTWTAAVAASCGPAEGSWRAATEPEGRPSPDRMRCGGGAAVQVTDLLLLGCLLGSGLGLGLLGRRILVSSLGRLCLGLGGSLGRLVVSLVSLVSLLRLGGRLL